MSSGGEHIDLDPPVIRVVRQPSRVAWRLKRRFFLARRPLRLGARRAAQLELVLAGLRDFGRIMCSSAPGSRLIEREGVVASVVPAAGECPMMNAVVYEQAANLAQSLDYLAMTYDTAGVEASVVYAPAVDGEAKKLLNRSGHLRIASTTAMARKLDRVARPADRALDDWTEVDDATAMAAICDRAFSFGNAFTRTFCELPRNARIYIASLRGEPVSCVMTSDHDGNCAVNLMATVPEAQGRGLAAALLGHVLVEAAEHGCSTTTVVASRTGEHVYRQQGYSVVCPIQHWVRQQPADTQEALNADHRAR